MTSPFGPLARPGVALPAQRHVLAGRDSRGNADRDRVLRRGRARRPGISCMASRRRCPRPPHVGHGATLTNCPKNDRCARRTSPVPAHVGHRCGFVPGSAPDPLHASHVSSSLTVNDFSTPCATSASVRSATSLMSPPERLGCPRVAEQIAQPAKAAEIPHEDVERVSEIDVRRPATSTQSRLAVPIVQRALVGVAQDVVRLGDRLELLLGVLRPVVAVGVVLHGELSVRLLDLVVASRRAKRRGRRSSLPWLVGQAIDVGW